LLEQRRARRALVTSETKTDSFLKRTKIYTKRKVKKKRKVKRTNQQKTGFNTFKE
jgi:hypothetical protein